MPRLAPLVPLALLALLAGCGGSAAPPADGAVYEEGDLVIRPVTADGLVEEIRAAESDLVVINFWASWCLPCREEFPDFVRYEREHEDVAVRFVSADFEDELPFAVQFLEQQGYTGTSYLKVGQDNEFRRAISDSWSGAIPATAVYDRTGARLAFWEGKVTYDELSARVDAARQSL